MSQLFTIEINPQVIGVEDVEFADCNNLTRSDHNRGGTAHVLTGLEFFIMFGRDLCNFKQSDNPIILWKQ